MDIIAAGSRLSRSATIAAIVLTLLAGIGFFTSLEWDGGEPESTASTEGDDLEACLAVARTVYLSDLEQACSDLGMDSDCSLPFERAQELFGRHTDAQERCHEIYPQLKEAKDRELLSRCLESAQSFCQGSVPQEESDECVASLQAECYQEYP